MKLSVENIRYPESYVTIFSNTEKGGGNARVARRHRSPADSKPVLLAITLSDCSI